MLQPHELAAAHSFGAHYHFCGTRDDQVRQIGNSVPVQLGRALGRCALGAGTPAVVTVEAVA
jgi:site-specific DNA-cytosine methylase